MEIDGLLRLFEVDSQKNINKNGVTQIHPSLILLHQDRPTGLEASVYNPVVCLILQGAKETILGTRLFRFGKGQMLIVSHDVPVNSRIMEASVDEPYLALILNLDLKLLRSLYDQIEDNLSIENSESSLSLVNSDSLFRDALGRLINISGSVTEEPVLGPLVLKELHFRLLMSSGGGVLRRLLRLDSNASKVWKAIKYIREHFRQPLSVPELAEYVSMGVSSFHTHFKGITETTPLQYQKDLRLLEAKRILYEGEQSVTDVAFEVGYESPTQFSREYSRKFGISPRQESRIRVA